jgi:curved DNA-binding protein CbpA
MATASTGIATRGRRRRVCSSPEGAYIRDAYLVLQVLPTAEDAVIHAAFRALARIYHPDGTDPDPRRMTELNGAYARVRSPQRRHEYGSALHPMGPGVAQQAPPPDASRGGVFARAAQRAGRDVADTRRLDFGRYVDWSLTELARHDPSYLRWLARHSSGLRYRREIERVLGNIDVGQRDRSSA